MVKAEQTGLWHIAPDGSEVERLSPPKDPEYDFDRIARKLAELEQFDAAWLTWFKAEGIEPLRIGYESLSANALEAVARICKALGVAEPAPARVKVGVGKLADAVSLEWKRRYQAEIASPTSRANDARGLESPPAPRSICRRHPDLRLLTAHRAKGQERDDVVVLYGDWEELSRGEDRYAPRRR